MPGLRCTPTSTAGHAASNCTLPPKIVHGVDQATTGMVRPVHVCVGVVFLQPQSTVLMAYQPGASGVPVFSPTVSPGCVTDPARAGAAVQSDRKAAVANFVSLLFMLAPLEVPRRCVVARPYNNQGLRSRLGWGRLAGGHRIFRQPLPKWCRPSVELT